MKGAVNVSHCTALPVRVCELAVVLEFVVSEATTDVDVSVGELVVVDIGVLVRVVVSVLSAVDVPVVETDVVIVVVTVSGPGSMPSSGRLPSHSNISFI